MRRYLPALLLLILSLAGCATTHSTYNTNRERLVSLPMHYTQFDALLSWEVVSSGNETLIDGEFKNVRWDYMYDLEVWVAALDPAGKTMARSVSYLPHVLYRDEIAPFTMKLPSVLAPGTKLRFTYKYAASEGGDDEGGGRLSWMQSFDAEMPGPR